MPAAISAAFFRVEDLALSTEASIEFNFEKICDIGVSIPDYSVSSNSRLDRTVEETSWSSFEAIVLGSPMNSD